MNTSLIDVKELTDDLTENILPQLESTNLENQNDMKDLELEFTRVRNKFKSDVTDIKQTVGNIKNFKQEFQKLKKRTNKIDERFTSLNKTIQDNFSGQEVELGDDNEDQVEFSGGFRRVLEKSDTVVLDDVPESLVDNAEFEKMKKTIKELEDGMELQ